MISHNATYGFIAELKNNSSYSALLCAEYQLVTPPHILYFVGRIIAKENRDVKGHVEVLRHAL